MDVDAAGMRCRTFRLCLQSGCQRLPHTCSCSMCRSASLLNTSCWVISRMHRHVKPSGSQSPQNVIKLLPQAAADVLCCVQNSTTMPHGKAQVAWRMLLTNLQAWIVACLAMCIKLPGHLCEYTSLNTSV